MSYCEEDFANLPMGRVVAEGHLTHLSELDPTHATAQPARPGISHLARTNPAWLTSSPSCVLPDMTAAAVLLELDPTHFPVR